MWRLKWPMDKAAFRTLWMHYKIPSLVKFMEDGFVFVEEHPMELLGDQCISERERMGRSLELSSLL